MGGWGERRWITCNNHCQVDASYACPKFCDLEHSHSPYLTHCNITGEWSKRTKNYAVYAGQMGIVLDTRAETIVGLSLTALQLHSYRSVCFEIQIKVRNFLTERQEFLFQDDTLPLNCNAVNMLRLLHPQRHGQLKRPNTAEENYNLWEWLP